MPGDIGFFAPKSMQVSTMAPLYQFLRLMILDMQELALWQTWRHWIPPRFQI